MKIVSVEISYTFIPMIELPMSEGRIQIAY